MEFDFLKQKEQEIKEELKDRKQWKKALVHEYGLERTFKEGRQIQIIKMVEIANIMIKHYEEILKQYQEMIKECESVRK